MNVIFETIASVFTAIVSGSLVYLFQKISRKNKLECQKLELEIEILNKKLGKQTEKDSSNIQMPSIIEAKGLKWIGLSAGVAAPIYKLLLNELERVSGISWFPRNETFWENLFLEVIVMLICGSMGIYVAPKLYSKLKNWLVVFISIVIFSAIISNPIQSIFRPTIKFLMQVYYR